MKPTAKPSKRPRPYRKSGLHAAKAALSKRGLSALDGRSAIARAVRAWWAAVASDLGGEAELSQQQRTLLDVAAQDVVLLQVADSWLQEHAGSVVNKRRRAFVPLVEQRLRVAAHLAGLLKDLGLERKAKPVPTLAEYLQTRSYGSTGANGSPDGAQAQPEPERPTEAQGEPA